MVAKFKANSHLAVHRIGSFDKTDKKHCFCLILLDVGEGAMFFTAVLKRFKAES